MEAAKCLMQLSVQFLVFDALICHHEPDVSLLQEQVGVDQPITFMPFYFDSEYFKKKKPFKLKTNRAAFKGNAFKYFTHETYSKRSRLMEALSECVNVDLLPFNNAELKSNPIAALEDYINHLNSYCLLLNLPSLAPTLTVRPFEIMGLWRVTPSR